MLQAVTVNELTIHNDSKITTEVHCAFVKHELKESVKSTIVFAGKHTQFIGKIDWKSLNWWLNQTGIPLEVTCELLIFSYTVRADFVSVIQCQLYQSLGTNNRTEIE